MDIVAQSLQLMLLGEGAALTVMFKSSKSECLDRQHERDWQQSRVTENRIGPKPIYMYKPT